MSSFTVLSVYPHQLQAASSLASSHSGFYAPSKSRRYSSRNGPSTLLKPRPSFLDVPRNHGDKSSSGIIRSCQHGGGAPPPWASSCMERREMLAASLLIASTLLFSPSTSAATDAVQPPADVGDCVAPTSDGNALPFLTELDYCMGLGGQNITATLYQFPSRPTRVRRAAHKMTVGERSDYNEAYRRMRALSDEDPRSLRRQAAIHAAFCNFVYKGRQGESDFLNMHGNDLFLPWHRFFLYFHERILGDLIGKPTFALPYWNWDDQVEGGNTMPTVYEQESLYPSLLDVKRNQLHLPPVMVDLGWPRIAEGSASIAENTSIMHKGVVAATTPSLFMGGSFLSTPSTGSLEGIHNSLHGWTGDPTYEITGEDMGQYYSAGRDPIFYAHHANVDRLWGVWENLPGTNTDDLNDLYQDSNFRESSFVFFDEKSNLVKVSIADCLTSSSKLNISYEPATIGDANWINYTPEASSQNLAKSQAQKIASTTALKGPLSLIDTISTLISPPPIWERRSSPKQPILVLENVTLFMSNPISFAVFINFPDANSKTGLDCAEFVGLYTTLPHLDMPGMTGPDKMLLKFPLRESLDILHLDVSSPLVVTVVARSNIDPIKYPVTIGGFRIIYE